MKALVTGATGFVGSHLVERLLAEGVEVACLVRPTSNLAHLRKLPVETRVGSLADADSLAAAVEAADYVFHAAALTRGRTRGEYFAANVEGTRRLLEAAVRRGVAARRFVYVGSLAAVGPNRGAAPLDETAPPRPIDDYGASKLAAERLVMEQARRLPVTIVRPPSVYGPRDRNFLSVFRLARRLGRVPMLAGPRSELTVVEASDLARGLWLAGSSPAAAGRTYFLGSGTHTMPQLVGAVSAALGRPLRAIRVPPPVAVLAGEIGELWWSLTGRPQIISRRKVRDALQERWTCSWARAREELGYRPAVGLEEGFRRTAAWYVRAGWLKG
jgi:nucleoside-diphosphate-sugar epimerase